MSSSYYLKMKSLLLNVMLLIKRIIVLQWGIFFNQRQLFGVIRLDYIRLD